MRKAFYLSFLFIFSFLGPLEAQIKVSLPSFGVLHDQTDTLELYIIGDVMMHTRQLDYDCKPFLEQLQPRLKGADIAIANLEFALGGKPYSGYPAFSTPEYYPKYLAEDCGIDVFLCANNHILDKGAAGLERTLGIYRQMSDTLGIKFTGIASDPEEYALNFPLFVRGNGIRIAIINFTYGTNNRQKGDWPKVQYMDREEIARAFSIARQKADFIVVLPHWGTEYSLSHDKDQEEWAEWLVGQGADVIVGAHPHVVQDKAIIRGVPVYYSVGNAVSNMSAENTRLELGVSLKFVRNRISGRKGMLEPRADYLWCTLPGRITDSYSTVPVKEWATRKDGWLIPSDYDNMMNTLGRVSSATGIPY